jgi:hypothetical protein
MNEDERDQRQDSDFTPIGASLSSLFPQLLGGDFSPLQDATSLQKPDPQTKAGKKPAKTKAALGIAAAEITARPNKTEAAYLARELVQCTLPHRDPGDVPAWVRRNGNFSLVLQPGFDEESMKSVGLPYGSIPRLLMLWIVTEAVKNKNCENPRHIKLGETLNKFLLEIGLNPRTGGGKRSDAKRLKEQMLRLFQCRFSFKYSEGDEEKGSKSFLNMELAREAHFWWDFKNPDQGSLFNSEIVLGEVFFEAITAHAVPVDFRALKALKQSSFALDLYTWATYRVFRLQDDKQRQVKIPLHLLQEQFGTEYSRLDNFKAALSEGLAKVQQVFPALDYTVEKNTLILRDGKARAIPTREERPSLPQQRVQQMARQISPRARMWFEKNHRGLDIETAISDFNFWVDKKHVEPRSVDAVFITFVRDYWAK